MAEDYCESSPGRSTKIRQTFVYRFKAETSHSSEVTQGERRFRQSLDASRNDCRVPLADAPRSHWKYLPRQTGHYLRNKPLSPDTAWQTSQQPMIEVATGLRLCETLGLHTSRVDIESLTIGHDRQLDPRRPWRVGQSPPLIPPKHNKSRTANIWPVYVESLERLMHHADHHTNGWLFPPTGRQEWRAKARETEWNRAIRLMKLLRDDSIAAGVPEEDLPALWSWKPHYTRHTYGSYSLAPVGSGGLGWSVLSVKESMGHQSEKTIMEIYRHVTSEERTRVRTTTISWPGLI